MEKTREFTVEYGDPLYLESKALSIELIETDDDGDGEFEHSWSADDWEVEGDAPFSVVYVASGGPSFPTGENAVRVTADWQ